MMSGTACTDANGCLHRLYERLGFVRESRKREHFFYDGRYWDQIGLGMLEHEWREKYGGEEDAVVGASKTEP